MGLECADLTVPAGDLGTEHQDASERPLQAWVLGKLLGYPGLGGTGHSCR